MSDTPRTDREERYSEEEKCCIVPSEFSRIIERELAAANAKLAAMPNPIDDGGPAFPVAGYDNPNHGRQYGVNGMSLRDWFAGMAMQGALACPTPSNQWDAMASSVGLSVDDFLGKRMFQLADAMLAARKGGA